MTDFNSAFDKMIVNEGGYKLTEVKGDRGGQTYAGIARKAWPRWDGWTAIDDGQTPSTQSVRDFYKVNFWDKVQGDFLEHQRVAVSLFDFAVNAGVKTAIKLAQIIAGTAPDGVLGDKTLGALNTIPEDDFVARYALAKVARYAQIVTHDRSQGKFLLGWINRTLREVV